MSFAYWAIFSHRPRREDRSVTDSTKPLRLIVQYVTFTGVRIVSLRWMLHSWAAAALTTRDVSAERAQAAPLLLQHVMNTLVTAVIDDGGYWSNAPGFPSIHEIFSS